MNRCAAVRKRGAIDQCLASALKGVVFCGRHARTRGPVLWASLHAASPVVRIQALVRGWLLRRRLAHAGPGVVSRKNLAHDEDLFTCEVKERQHPMSYFAFEEAGKIWWFDAQSLWVWMVRSVEPVNPYTKVPIPPEARRRLRMIQRHDRLSYGAKTVADMMSCRWNAIVQIFRDNGFIDVHPQQFTNFEEADYITMFVFLERDLQVVLSEQDIHRGELLRLSRRGLVGRRASRLHYAYLLLRMLSIPRDPYVVVFSILSAFYRC